MPEDRDIVLAQIGLRIIRRREALGWNQKELARRLGVAQTSVSRIEYGKQNLTIDTLCKLADALDTTLAELITGMPARE